MTVIVAARDPRGGIVIGSDSQATNGADFVARVSRKWIEHGDWAIATAGHARGLNLLNWRIEELLRGLPPVPGSIPELERRLFDMLEADGWNIGYAEQHGPKKTDQGFIACNSSGLIYEFTAVRSVFRHKDWVTDGNGYHVAAGAMFALWTAVEAGKITAEDAVRIAVAAAIELMDGCGGEIRVRRLWAREQRRATHEEADEGGEGARPEEGGQGEPPRAEAGEVPAPADVLSEAPAEA